MRQYCIAKEIKEIADFPEIEEIEANPLVFDGRNAVAVDACVLIDKENVMYGTQTHEHLVIAPYPKKYVVDWELKNETPVLLRPTKPEDETLLDEMFRSLSEETMRMRFFQIIKQIPHETLTRYCNLDHDREIPVVAEKRKAERNSWCRTTHRGAREGVWRVRSCCCRSVPRTGLGSRLIDCTIEIAKDLHLKTVYGYIISTSTKMVHLCASKGFSMEAVDEEITKVTLSLS